MATFNDFSGVYFTVQSLRAHHAVGPHDEIVVVDNYGCNRTRAFIESIPEARYERCLVRGTAAPREQVFTTARGDYVMCCDSHVLFMPGAIAGLRTYFEQHPDSLDLVQGPVLSDDLTHPATHFAPEWRELMWGVWDTDERGVDPAAQPFEIPMQGLGVFACRRDAWLGFNPAFRGFGGEEGYIHEKFRRAGRRCLCLPALRWIHRFSPAGSVPYEVTVRDRVRNYLIGHQEVDLPISPILEHFAAHFDEGEMVAIVREALDGAADPAVSGHQEAIARLRTASNPFGHFDAIFCLNLDSQPERWAQATARFERLGIADAVERFPAIATPDNHHRGNAMSFRAMVQEADRREAETMLLVEDDAVWLDETVPFLQQMLAALESREWDLFYLGACLHGQEFGPLGDSAVLQHCGPVTCTHAVAVHRSAYARILAAVPEDPAGFEEWITREVAIDQYFWHSLAEKRYDAVLAAPRLASQPALMLYPDGDLALAERYVI